MPNETPAPVPQSAGYSSTPFVGLCGVTLWLTVWKLWLVNSTYERYRGRTDLDIPDWFVINFGLMLKVVGLTGAASVLLLFAAVGFVDAWPQLTRAGRFWHAFLWVGMACLVGLTSGCG